MRPKGEVICRERMKMNQTDTLRLKVFHYWWDVLLFVVAPGMPVQEALRYNTYRGLLLLMKGVFPSSSSSFCSSFSSVFTFLSCFWYFTEPYLFSRNSTAGKIRAKSLTSLR